MINKLIWVDLETTGLCAADGDEILEVAMIVTAPDLKELDRISLVLNSAKYWELKELSDVVQKMHTQNGLWNESLSSKVSMDEADQRLSSFLAPHLEDEPGKVCQLAGSTVAFDRNFMNVHFPLTSSKFHYRSLDVTAFNEVARRFWPRLHADRPQSLTPAHRAMPDLLESISVLKYYIKYLGKDTQ